MLSDMDFQTVRLLSEAVLAVLAIATLFILVQTLRSGRYRDGNPLMPEIVRLERPRAFRVVVLLLLAVLLFLIAVGLLIALGEPDCVGGGC